MNLGRRKLAIGILGLALLACAAGWYTVADRADGGALTELNATSFAELKKEFNAAADEVRVIVLLSPS